MKIQQTMRKYFNLLLIILITGFVSCDKYLEPETDNTVTEDILIKKPNYAEGVLLRAYVNLPNEYYFYTDVATDDAVTNLQGSSYTRMATGEWTANFYPMNPWSSSFESIFYINKFLEIYQSVKWASDPRFSQVYNNKRNELYKKRLKGEAYGLRAWYKFQLLQHHGGKAPDGTLLGFPIIDKNVTVDGNWKLPRNTFAECVQSIFNDLDTAIASLPPTYVNINNDTVDQCMGARYRNRMNGNAAWALKSRVALLAASPAFAASSGVTWAQAATISGNLLKNLGALLATGKTFYTTTNIKEIIWNRSVVQKRTWEQNNFPPSLFGSARTNPSQNLVDAFPMKNGYPITHNLSLYDSTKPYTGRDTRLSDYIIYNGTSFKSTTINTYIGAASDGINTLLTSTRTGYYMKKFMLPGVSCNPASPANAAHNYTLFRETEVLLNFAEAANEAWGPDADPNGYGFTAKTKIKDLRTRAGITAPDPYLTSISSTDSLRTLIRNERRLELCFEGFRFWDIRRWNDITLMQTPVKGAYITNDAGSLSYSYDVVEERNYSPYMIYGPIPFSETLKYNIQQNNGW